MGDTGRNQTRRLDSRNRAGKNGFKRKSMRKACNLVRLQSLGVNILASVSGQRQVLSTNTNADVAGSEFNPCFTLESIRTPFGIFPT
jgi:hypothetical protein